MRRLFFMCILLLAFLLQSHAYEQRNLLEKAATESQVKEYLVLNQAWAKYPAYSDRAGWNQLLGENKELLIKAGERYLGYNWIVVKATDYIEYEKSGSRNIMQDPNNKNTKAFGVLLMAELAEGKGRFMGDIINGVLFFSEMTSWAESAHLAAYQKTRRAFPDYREDILELHQGGKAQMLSWTYYFLHKEFDKWDPAISIRLRHELQKREIDPYLRRSDFWWQATNATSKTLVNNWNPWCNSNALMCFMLLVNDRDSLATAVYKSMVSVDKYLNYVKTDGACEEGPSYWEHAAGKLYDYLSELSLVTGGKLSIFHQPMVKAMGEYITRSYIGDGWVVNFADASARSTNNLSLIYRYGKAVGSQEMIKMAADLNKVTPVQLPTNWLDFYEGIETVRTMKELNALKGGYKAPSFTWYPETQFCYMRNGASFFATKGGHNGESHNHNDVGSFILCFNDTPIMIDAGVGTYTRLTFSSQRYSIWTMQSNYHNLPIINGIAQKDGSSYKARDVKVDAKKYAFSLDIAGAYPQEAAVDRWIRSYQLKKDRLLISDQFALSRAKTPSQINFLTWGKVDVSTPGLVCIQVKDKVVHLTYDARAFTASAETVTLTDKTLSKVWGKEIYRISLNAKSTVKEGRYQYEVIMKK
jgi:hypothetical protein